MQEYELCKIEAKDYKYLKSFFAMRPARTCESICNSSYIWRDYYNARYYKNKYGIVFLYKVGDEVFSSSPLCKKEDIKASIEDIRRYFNEVLGRKMLMYVADQDTVDALEGDDRFIIEEDRRYFDYVYDAEKLRTLSGKKYHKKKNHLNAFLKEYSGRYETKILGTKDRDEICEFIDRWHSMRDIEDEFERDKYEVSGIKSFLDQCTQADVYMLGVFIDGVLQAFTLGTYLKDLEMVFVHVEKANPDIRGLYVFVNKEFQSVCFPEARLVNREDDMGLEGLRHAKMSYNPVYLEKKYNIREK